MDKEKTPGGLESSLLTSEQVQDSRDMELEYAMCTIQALPILVPLYCWELWGTGKAKNRWSQLERSRLQKNKITGFLRVKNSAPYEDSVG